MKGEYDFSKAEQGKFHVLTEDIRIPIYLDKNIKNKILEKPASPIGGIMHIEADLDPIHSQRLDELRVRMKRPIAEILAEAIDALYRKETPGEDEDAIIRRLKGRFSHIPPGESLANELIAERRQEALQEDRP
jgi:hypothetical protein